MEYFYLTLPEKYSIAQLLSEIFNGHDSIETESFFLEAHIFAQELPRRLRKAFYQFKLEESTTGICIRNSPIDLNTMPKTPSRLPLYEEEKYLTKEEALHILYASLLGEPFNWSSQQNGRILNEILPLRENVGKTISTGSDQLFDLHTEDAFHAYMSDYLGFLCMRNPDGVATVISQLEMHDLDDKIKSILFEPRFLVQPNVSHAVQRTQIPVPVLFGHPDTPYLRVNLNVRDSSGDDEEAKMAFNILTDVLIKNSTDLILEPAEYCYLDNFRIVHGRKPFSPTYDGNDRWLKRILITNDLRKSRSLRNTVSDRIIRPIK